MMANVNEVTENKEYSLEDIMVLNIVNSTSREERDMAVSAYREFLEQM